MEAETKNAQLCKGKGQHRLDKILSCLDDAEIARYYKEELSAVPRIKSFSAGVRPVLKFEVRVLKADLAKAQIAVQQVTGDEDDASPYRFTSRTEVLVAGLLCVVWALWSFRHGPLGIFATSSTIRLLLAGIFAVFVAVFAGFIKKRKD